MNSALLPQILAGRPDDTFYQTENFRLGIIKWCDILALMSFHFTFFTSSVINFPPQLNFASSHSFSSLLSCHSVTWKHSFDADFLFVCRDWLWRKKNEDAVHVVRWRERERSVLWLLDCCGITWCLWRHYVFLIMSFLHRWLY